MFVNYKKVIKFTPRKTYMAWFKAFFMVGQGLQRVRKTNKQ